MSRITLFSKNGTLLPIEKALVPVTSVEVAYGYGVYESVRVSKGVVYFLEAHINRLFDSMHGLGIEITVSREKVIQYVLELTNALASETYNLKILVYGATRPLDAQIYIIPSNPLFPDKKLYRDGVSVITVEHERLYPNVKSLNMLGSYCAYKKARGVGAYDALLMNTSGCLLEGTRTNFYAVRGATVYTAPNKYVLQGVTREIILRVARETGIQVKFQCIAQKDLQTYDAFFLSSTSSKIMPIAKIDEHMYAVHEVTRILMQGYTEYLKKSGGKLQ